MAGLLTIRKTRKISGKSSDGGDGDGGGPGSGNSAGGSDGGTNSGNDGHSGSGGTNTAHGSTASNNGNSGYYSGSYNPITSPNAVAEAFHGGEPDAFSSEANPGFTSSDNVDFSGGLSGKYGGINVGGISSGANNTGGYSLGLTNNFSSPFDSYDKYGGLSIGDGLSNSYSSGLIDEPSLWDNVKNFALENPLSIVGGLLGLGVGGPLAALGLSRTGSLADDVTNPSATTMDRLSGIMGLTGAPGLMGLAAKGFAKAAEAMGATNPNPGVNPDVNTYGNAKSYTQQTQTAQPKVEYKFDPIANSGGLLNNNMTVNRKQLNEIIKNIKGQRSGLLGGLNLNAVKSDIRQGGLNING